MKSLLKLLAPLLLLALPSPLINLRLDLDRTFLPAGQTEKTVIKVLLDVPQIENSNLRPPVNLTPVPQCVSIVVVKPDRIIVSEQCHLVSSMWNCELTLQLQTNDDRTSFDI